MPLGEWRDAIVMLDIDGSKHDCRIRHSVLVVGHDELCNVIGHSFSIDFISWNVLVKWGGIWTSSMPSIGDRYD